MLASQGAEAVSSYAINGRGKECRQCVLFVVWGILLKGVSFGYKAETYRPRCHGTDTRIRL